MAEKPNPNKQAVIDKKAFIDAATDLESLKTAIKKVLGLE